MGKKKNEGIILEKNDLLKCGLDINIFSESNYNSLIKEQKIAFEKCFAFYVLQTPAISNRHKVSTKGKDYLALNVPNFHYKDSFYNQTVMVLENITINQLNRVNNKDNFCDSCKGKIDNNESFISYLKDGSNIDSVLVKLRNSFAHGNFAINIIRKNVFIKMININDADRITFIANIELTQLSKLIDLMKNYTPSQNKKKKGEKKKNGKKK